MCICIIFCRFFCICRPGYKNGNCSHGRFCSQVIDRCQESSPCRNGGKCLPTGPGTYQCLCSKWWTGSVRGTWWTMKSPTPTPCDSPATEFCLLWMPFACPLLPCFNRNCHIDQIWSYKKNVAGCMIQIIHLTFVSYVYPALRNRHQRM